MWFKNRRAKYRKKQKSLKLSSSENNDSNTSDTVHVAEDIHVTTSAHGLEDQTDYTEPTTSDLEQSMHKEDGSGSDNDIDVCSEIVESLEECESGIRNGHGGQDGDFEDQSYLSCNTVEQQLDILVDNRAGGSLNKGIEEGINNANTEGVCSSTNKQMKGMFITRFGILFARKGGRHARSKSGFRSSHIGTDPRLCDLSGKRYNAISDQRCYIKLLYDMVNSDECDNV